MDLVQERGSPVIQAQESIENIELLGHNIGLFGYRYSVLNPVMRFKIEPILGADKLLSSFKVFAMSIFEASLTGFLFGLENTAHDGHLNARHQAEIDIRFNPFNLNMPIEIKTFNLGLSDNRPLIQADVDILNGNIIDVNAQLNTHFRPQNALIKTDLKIKTIPMTIVIPESPFTNAFSCTLNIPVGTEGSFKTLFAGSINASIKGVLDLTIFGPDLASIHIEDKDSNKNVKLYDGTISMNIPLNSNLVSGEIPDFSNTLPLINAHLAPNRISAIFKIANVKVAEYKIAPIYLGPVDNIAQACEVNKYPLPHWRSVNNQACIASCGHLGTLLGQVSELIDGSCYDQGKLDLGPFFDNYSSNGFRTDNRHCCSKEISPPPTSAQLPFSPSANCWESGQLEWSLVDPPEDKCCSGQPLNKFGIVYTCPRAPKCWSKGAIPGGQFKEGDTCCGDLVLKDPGGLSPRSCENPPLPRGWPAGLIPPNQGNEGDWCLDGKPIAKNVIQNGHVLAWVCPKGWPDGNIPALQGWGTKEKPIDYCQSGREINRDNFLWRCPKIFNDNVEFNSWEWGYGDSCKSGSFLVKPTLSFVWHCRKPKIWERNVPPGHWISGDSCKDNIGYETDLIGKVDYCRKIWEGSVNDWKKGDQCKAGTYQRRNILNIPIECRASKTWPTGEVPRDQWLDQAPEDNCEGGHPVQKPAFGSFYCEPSCWSGNIPALRWREGKSSCCAGKFLVKPFGSEWECRSPKAWPEGIIPADAGVNEDTCQNGRAIVKEFGIWFCPKCFGPGKIPAFSAGPGASCCDGQPIKKPIIGEWSCPYPAASTPQTQSNPILGYVDAQVQADNGKMEIHGWACQQNYTGPIDLHVYFSNQSTPNASTDGPPLISIADTPSEAAIANACGGGNSHRFKIEYGQEFLKNKTNNNIFVYGIPKVLGGASRVLPFSGTPFKTPQGAIKGAFGNIDRLNLKGVGQNLYQWEIHGWACDPYYIWTSYQGAGASPPTWKNKPTLLHVYLGGKAGTSGATGFSDPSFKTNTLGLNFDFKNEIAKICGASNEAWLFGGGGFRIPISLEMMKNHGGKKIHVHGIAHEGANTQIGGGGVLTVPHLQPVLGHIDGFEAIGDGSFVLNGWACQKGLDEAINTHLYVGGESGASSVVYSRNIDLAQFPPNNATDCQQIKNACQTQGCHHRFKIPISKDQIVHKSKPVFVYGIAKILAENSKLARSGTIVIPSPVVKGNLEGIVELSGVKYLKGWACETGNSNSIDVQFYVGASAGGAGATYIGNYKTDIVSEAAVQSTCQDPSAGSKHRFLIPLTKLLLPHIGKGIFIHGIAQTQGLSNNLINNSTQIKVPTLNFGPSIMGYLEKIIQDGSESYLVGWVCEEGVNESIGFQVYVESGSQKYIQLGEYEANHPSATGINKACKTSSGIAHRFKVLLDSNYWAYIGKTVFILGISKKNLGTRKFIESLNGQIKITK